MQCFHDQSSPSEESQQIAPETYSKKWLALGCVALAVLIIASIFTGYAGKLLKGDFEFLPPGYRQPIQLPPSSDRNARANTPTPEERAKTQQDRMSDQTAAQKNAGVDFTSSTGDTMSPEARNKKQQDAMSDQTAVQKNADVVFTSTADDDAKKKAEDDAKQKVIDDAKKAADDAAKAGDQIVVTIPQGFPQTIMVDPTKLNAQNPVEVAKYHVCVEGIEDATIKSIAIGSNGSVGNKSIQVYQGTKAFTPVISVSANPPTKEFLTLDTPIIPQKTCSDFTVKMLSADAESTWQEFYFNGITASLKVIAKGTAKDGTSMKVENSELQSLAILKSESFVHIQSAYSMKDITYEPDGGAYSYGAFHLSTKPNSQATIKSATVRLLSPSGKKISVSPLTWLQYVDNWSDQYYKMGSPYVQNVGGNPIELAPDQDVVIPLNIAIPYKNKLILDFIGDPGQKSPVDFTIQLISVDTDATTGWDGPSPLSTSTIHIVDNNKNPMTYEVQPSPISGAQPEWKDAGWIKKSLASGFNPQFASLNITPLNAPTPAPEVMVKNLTIKVGGLFLDPLKIRVTNGAAGYDFTVPKNGIITIPDHKIFGNDYLNFELLDYPATDAILTVKLSIQTLDFAYAADGVNYKAGDPVPFTMKKYDPSKGFVSIPNPKWPQSFGIISLGPTTLVKTTDSTKPAVTYVTIADLPKGQTSEFEVSHICFVAQGDSLINELTYKHTVRTTSPFKDIKLNIGGVDAYLKSDNWTKELATFTLTNPMLNWNGNNFCASLKVIDPTDPVEDFWFSLVGANVTVFVYSNMGGAPIDVPVYVGGKLLKDNPVDGSHYTFK